MELRDALKTLRSELGLTQTDLAAALRVNYATVSRWEAGKTCPNRSLSASLLEFARASGASERCFHALTQSLADASRAKIERHNGELYTVEHSTLSRLIEDASFPIYVTDIETDELLYMNTCASELCGVKLSQQPGLKCYSCFMHRDAPCTFCHKEKLTAERFTGFDAFRPESGTFHRVQGKLINWHGRSAQIRYITDMSGAVSISARKERALAYGELLRRRREYAANALASSHYNLTQNTVSEVETTHPEWLELLTANSVDELLRRIGENRFPPEEQAKIDSIKDRDSMIRLFYQGRTHITIRHYIEGLHGFYEGSFDLMQNPVTYDIEAFAALRDISDETLANDIVNTLCRTDYDTIAVINADTGEARPFRKGHIDEVIAEQRARRDNVEGVAAYLRRHCAGSDVERVILETSLPYVKRALETRQAHTVAYTLAANGSIAHRRVLYAYLDETRKMILCAIQDVTDMFSPPVDGQPR